jgi:hypothetical protein
VEKLEPTSGLHNTAHQDCAQYLDARMFGICSYFRQGYLTVAAFSMYDLLRYYYLTNPSFLLSAELKGLSAILGVNLPSGSEEIQFWAATELNIASVKRKVELAYDLIKV